MGVGLYVIFFAVSLCASVAGAICGIGGGVLMKPLLDVFGVLDVATISFLSGCAVLSMSCYSVVKARMSGDSLVDVKTGTPLAIGAAIGGVAGKEMFTYVAALSPDRNRVGAVQAFCLLLITFGTLIYTINKQKIKTHHVKNAAACIGIGIVLGIFSSFLGIGGGPINLVVLFFFFSMNTRTAAQNSLYIILFSQIASLVISIVTKTVPDFTIWLLIIMVTGGITGGALGRGFNKRLNEKLVDRLFIGLMVVIMGMCAYNIYHFI